MSEQTQVYEETINLPVPLSAEEQNAKLNELSRQSLRLENLTEERRETNGRFNTEIKQVRGVIKELCESTNSGRQVQPVAVKVEKDFAAGTIRKTRLDTGEVYQDRAMTDAERQMETVPGTGEGEDEPPKKRGRPKGAKNKPRDAEAQAAKDAVNGTSNGGGNAGACVCDLHSDKPQGTQWDCPEHGKKWINNFGEVHDDRNPDGFNGGIQDAPVPEMGS